MWAVRVRGLCAVAAVALLAALTPAPASAAVVTRDLWFTADDGVLLHATIAGASPLVARPLIIEDSPYAPGVAMPFGSAYNYVQLQWRGTGRSGGAWDTTGPRDQRDYAEFVAWACGQPWSNRRIGLYGFSASAIAAYNAIHLPMPCVKAAALMAGSVDLYRDLLYIGGIPAVAPGLVVFGGVFGPWLANLATRLNDQPVSLPASLMGYGAVPVDVAVHLTEDAYWRDRTFQGDLDHIPILADTSFYDVEPRGPFLAYEATRQYGSHLLVLGAHDGVPAGHPGPFPQYTRWFDHFVRGINNGIDREPSVSAYLSNGSRAQLQAGKFTRINGTTWPLAGTAWSRFYLSPTSSGSAHSLHDGGLSLTRPAKTTTQPYVFTPSDSLETDPHTTATIGASGIDQLAMTIPAVTNLALTEPTSITYTTPPLAAAIDAVGPASVDLFASSTAPETDLVAVVADVWPDGSAYPVATGQLRTSFPRVDRTQSGVDRATGEIVQPYADFSAKHDVLPGTMREYHVELLPIGNHFAAGHRLRLYIVGTPFDAQPSIPAVNTISLGGITPSRLILPTLGTSPRFK
jgi:uncharacterized protein